MILAQVSFQGQTHSCPRSQGEAVCGQGILQSRSRHLRRGQESLSPHVSFLACSFLFDFLPAPTSRAWNQPLFLITFPADLSGGVSLFCPESQPNIVPGPSHHANNCLRPLEGSQQNHSLTSDCSQETDPQLNFHTLSLLPDDRKPFISVSCVNQSSD